jgi:opacity protein-like surface antigen
MKLARELVPKEVGLNITVLKVLMAGMLLVGSVGQSGAAGIMDNGMYFGVQVAQINLEPKDVPDMDISALVLRIGYMPHENFGVEGRLGGGTSEEDSDFTLNGNDANLEVEIESFAGVYGVGRYHFNESASIYGLAGFTSFAIKRKLDAGRGPGSGSGTEDETSFSIGGGIDWGFSDKFSINLELMSYLDNDDFEATAISLGVKF